MKECWLLKRNHNSKKALQALMCTGLLILLIGFTKHLRMWIPLLGDVGAAIVMMYQLYLPIVLIQKNGETIEDYGLHHYGLLKDLKTLLVYLLIFFPLYGLGYFLSSYYFYPSHSFNGIPSLLPIAYTFVVHLLVVAIPEETFYRAFLQRTLLRMYPNKLFFLTIPLGRAILITSAFFALGHFVGEYDVGRLATFFPALLFSALAFRSTSIANACIFHAACNAYSEFLFKSFG